MTVVYRCLRGRQTWSIREGGRIVGHAAALTLRDVSFRVSAAGVARVRRRQQREVVAHARGILVASASIPPGAQRVRFDPYAATAFLLPDGSPVERTALVLFLADGTCWAVPHPECLHA